MMPSLGTVLWLLVTGWLSFLARVVPQMTAAPATLATGVVALLLFTAGLHALGRWTYAPRRPDLPAAWPWRWTLATLALIALLFVSGLSAVGLFRSTLWLARELPMHSA